MDIQLSDRQNERDLGREHSASFPVSTKQVFGRFFSPVSACQKLSTFAFRAETRTVQLSVHLKPYLRDQVIMQAAIGEWTANCSKVRKDVVRLIYLYLGKHEFFSAFHC